VLAAARRKYAGIGHSAIVSVHGAALPANAQAEGGLDIKVSFP
jgi:hypothetical protein